MLPSAKAPENKLPRFMSMIKPAGSQCNMACSYCYYLHKGYLLDQPLQPRMADTVLEEYIRQTIDAQTGPEVVFSWQGGEPCIMSLDFYQRVVELQTYYKKDGQSIENDLQTNGLLLDENWCSFLKENRFLVGISIDGPQKLHDTYRLSSGKKSAFSKVMHSVELLHRYQIPFSALCVVTPCNVKQALAVYRFLKKEISPGIIQFIPCVEPDGFEKSVHGNIRGMTNTHQVTPWTVSAEDWGWFLCRIWDEWIKHDFGKVFVDQFENIISLMFGYGSKKCVTSEYCGHALMLEHNGDLYSCDHFGYPEFRLGNIMQTHVGDLVCSPQQIHFAHAKKNSLPEYCRECQYLRLCWGECPKNRFMRTPDGQSGLNYLCPGIKIFYAKATASHKKLEKLLFGNQLS